MPTTAQHGIVTPEGVLLTFEEAGVGSRSLAIAIDLAMQSAALLALVLMLALAPLSGIPSSVATVTLVVMVFAILFGYPVAMETGTRGRTIGKMALGLRVVTTEGAPIQFRQAAIRGGLGIIDFYLIPFGVIAMVVVLLTRRGQRLGDLVAGTIVVRERQAGPSAASYHFPPPYGMEGYVSTLDVATLGDERYALVRSFLLRVMEFSPEGRQATGIRLANAVARRIRHTPPPQVHPEIFLACVAAAYQARQSGSALPGT